MNIFNIIYNTDCLEGLKTLPDESINCCVTSPPYYGLRDYGHDSQLGLEETPELFVDNLVKVFREVKRVLKKDGTLWLNLGDSYAGAGWRNNNDNPGAKQKTNNGTNISGIKIKTECKPKDLIGIPWMVAFALRADGWYLRQDIIWHKPNPMPESVTDRCTKAHEYIFLLSKSQKYYYDAEVIKTEMECSEHDARARISRKRFPTEKINGIRGNNPDKIYEYANKRSVWTVTTKPFSEAHFATFPEDLIEPCILAGCPENGIVLDPFFGAGTTGLVAVKNNRNYVGFEINPEYIKIAEKRILEPVEIKEFGYAKTKLNSEYPTLF